MIVKVVFFFAHFNERTVVVKIEQYRGKKYWSLQYKHVSLQPPGGSIPKIQNVNKWFVLLQVLKQCLQKKQAG